MLYGDRMKRFVEGLDRGQTTLFPRHVEDWIEEDNPVRVVDFFVDELDLGLLGFDGADIGYIWTAEGWLTLAIVLDLLFPAHCRLGNERPAEKGTGVDCTRAGNRRAGTVDRADPPIRPWQPVLCG